MSSPRNTVLYCQSCSQVGVMLTSIPKFNDFYIQLDDSNVGVQFLRPLNETIADLGEVVDAVIESGKTSSRDEKKAECRPLLYQCRRKQYAGVAHGVAGIYCTLMQVCLYPSLHFNSYVSETCKEP
ncbi:adenylate cyclase type 2-like [Vicugna pacos]|uniref:Adenylate cyclase type 2-like n=1 Tax=Vicugna pacos TaxID=30538 RepID=A0ABM5CKG8_VICPA